MSKKKSSLSKYSLINKKRLIFVVLLIINTVLVGVVFTNSSSQDVEGNSQDYAKGIEELNEANLQDFSEISDYMIALSETKGAEYAYEILKRADFPEGIDMHLLGHVVGDELFKQKGLDGIRVCTPDFRNACSHTIVIGLFLEQGEGVIEDIARVCHEAPGGKGAYTMCFHGFGHGVLAYTSYDMEKAVDLCSRVGSDEFAHREYIECVGGVTMEMMSGVHDREVWESQVDKYFSDADPLYPCTADFMPEEAREICLVYLTPHLFEVVGANLGNPTEENFANAFKLCSALNDRLLRDTCYGAFGKEFVVLAQGRDVRRIDQMNDDQLKTVYKWCLLSDTADGTNACIVHAVNSLFWGGENDRGAAVSFCSQVDDPGFQSTCIDALNAAVGFYIDDDQYKSAYCSELPSSYYDNCTSKLGV